MAHIHNGFKQGVKPELSGFFTFVHKKNIYSHFRLKVNSILKSSIAKTYENNKN